MDDLIKEMIRISQATKAEDPALELEIQKIINYLRGKSIDKAVVESLDHLLHHPKELTWKRLPDVLPMRDPFEPNQEQMDFICNLIRSANPEGMEWEMSTGQKYRVEPKMKTFTLIRDSDHPNSTTWFNNTAVILERLGWRMVTWKTAGRAFMATSGDWVISVTDFSIEDQENSATPGENFPKGSRGCDGAIGNGAVGLFLPIGHKIGRAFFDAAMPEYGQAKSTTAATELQKLTQKDKK